MSSTQNTLFVTKNTKKIEKGVVKKVRIRNQNYKIFLFLSLQAADTKAIW